MAVTLDVAKLMAFRSQKQKEVLDRFDRAVTQFKPESNWSTDKAEHCRMVYGLFHIYYFGYITALTKTAVIEPDAAKGALVSALANFPPTAADSVIKQFSAALDSLNAADAKRIWKEYQTRRI